MVLTGEMIDLLKSDVTNIVCMQPFGCLPNHVVGKGVIKELRHQYPKANIAAGLIMILESPWSIN